MSVIKEVLAGLKTTLELNTKVVSVANAVDRLAHDVRDLDRRLVRVPHPRFRRPAARH